MNGQEEIQHQNKKAAVLGCKDYREEENVNLHKVMQYATLVGK
jgi:hypothetical protein